MADLMKSAKSRQADYDRRTQTDTSQNTQVVANVEEERITVNHTLNSKFEPPTPPPPPPMQEDKNYSRFDTITSSTSRQSSDLHLMQPLTSSSSSPPPTNNNKLPSPNLPPAYFIPDGNSFEATNSLPDSFQTSFDRFDPEDRDEGPFDQKHVVHNDSIVQKPSLSLARSERDSMSNAQSTLRARRERLARRKLINR